MPDGRDRHDAGARPGRRDARRPAPDERAADGERAEASRRARPHVGGHARKAPRVDRPRARAPQAGDRHVRDLAFCGLTACLLAAAAAVVTAKSLFRATFALSFALVATARVYL